MADMNQAAPTGTDPTDADDTSPDMSQGYVIEIRVSADNKISVGVEPMAEEDQEESGEGEGGESDDYQSVGSVGEACKLVREIVAHGGQIADSGADSDAMAAGYGGKA